MKKFVKYTDQGNDFESSVKVGKHLPADAVNLRIL